jgi:uncharacterized protein YcsI (UPF0317 family)
MIDVIKQIVEALEWCHGGEPVGTADAIQAGKKLIAELESQEPVADDFFKMIADRNPKPFPLPQRTWAGLTDEEVKHEWEVWRANIPRYVGFAKGIEAKLKEKNI